MASTKKSSATPKDRPPAEQVAKDIYQQQFGKVSAADAGFTPDSNELGEATPPARNEEN